MDLPKGIVTNRPGISSDVKRINEEPVDSEIVAKLWRVYTTTKRTLRDPTAERLENYWWRIWGSRKRELRGATVAELFSYISDGSTFNGQPLLSKVPRFEGGSEVLRIQNDENISSDTSEEPSNTPGTRPSTSSKDSKKSITPMPPPILKKSRGPSNHGPRPTARFVSPSISPTNEHVVVRPPTPELTGEAEPQNPPRIRHLSNAAITKKKGKGHAVLAGRKRPTIVRRKSSQSAGEEQEPREKSENISPSREKSPAAQSRKHDGVSSKKTGSTGATESISGKSTNSDSGAGIAGPGPSTQSKASENALLGTQAGTVPQEIELDEDELEELEIQKLLLEEARIRKKMSTKDALPPGGDSRVRHNLKSVSLSNLKSAGDAILSSDVKGTASIAPRFANVAGEINAEPRKVDKGKGKEKDPLQFPKRAVPSLVAKNPSVDKFASLSVSKSQSQLALLLQQDKARKSEHDLKGKGIEKQIETASDDTQDEGLEMPLRKRR